jgi:hypothetical protein
MMPLSSPGCLLVAFSGPASAEKSDLLEAVRDRFRRRVALVHNAAELLAPAHLGAQLSDNAHRAVLRTLFHLQLDLERTAVEDGTFRVALCDGGTLDTIDFWPEDETAFWSFLGTHREQHLRRYATVVHLRPAIEPFAGRIRRVSAEQQRVEFIWRDHPRVVVLEGDDSFPDLVERTTMIVDEQLRRAVAMSGQPVRPVAQPLTLH